MLESAELGQFLIAVGRPVITCARCGQPITARPFLLYAHADKLWHWQCFAEPTLEVGSVTAGAPSRRWWLPTRLSALFAGWFSAGLAGCM